MALRNWVRLPSWWIEEGGLRELRWNKGEGADNIAALMVFCVIAHHANEHAMGNEKAELLASLTYDRLGLATGIESREDRGRLGCPREPQSDQASASRAKHVPC